MHKITCIQCPLGCQIKVEEKNNNFKFSGNFCIKGEEYSIQEIKNPTRILTTTVLVKNGKQLLLPVRSEKGLHKDLIKKCIFILSKVKVKAPIKYKDVIHKNILNTGINIIASRDINKK
jgi:CxxC motif-containing protein